MKKGRPKDKRWYALYKGDEIVTLGTLEEIEVSTGLRKRYLQWLKTPYYERCKVRKYKVILIDETDD